MVRGGDLGICQGRATHVTVVWHCLWGRGLRERRVLLAQLLAGFQSLPSLPTSKLGSSGADSGEGGFVYILGSLQQTPLWSLEFILPSQSPQVFTVRFWGFIFPCTGTLGCVVCVTPQLFQFICLQMWDRPLRQPLPCHESSLPQLPVSAPPTGLDECFFFNSLVVGLPYSLIFWQFWLFFVFKFVALLLVVWGGKVYLSTPPSWLEVPC